MNLRRSLCARTQNVSCATNPISGLQLSPAQPVHYAFLSFALALLLTACGGGGGGSSNSGGGGGSSSPALSSIAVTPANPTIDVGATEQFKAEGTYSDGSTKDLTGSVSWTSASTAVAKISASGLATAVASGATKISAGMDSIGASTTLRITPAAPGVTSISIVPSTATVAIGAPVQFTATASLSGGSTENLTDSVFWSSSDTTTATVNSSGLVSGVADGTATLTAVSGSLTASASITVVTGSGLPTGVGWHELPNNTELQASGDCPPDNFGGDPFLFSQYCPNVIRSWSGAIADTTHNRMLLWGGGHDNYYGNEIYSLNLNANPVTLTRAKDPTVPTNYVNKSNCVDAIPPSSPNAPNSRESYEGMAFIPSSDVMMIVDGALACLQGNGTISTWTIPLASLSNSTNWVNETPTVTGPTPATAPGSAYGNIAAYDPNSGLVFVADSSAIYTYNYSTNTYNKITATDGFLTDIYLSGAIDPTRKLFVTVGACDGGTCPAGHGVFVADISNPTTTTQQDWTANSMAQPVCEEFLSGGVNPINAANPGFTFDSVADDFVGWPNQGNSVYIITPDVANQRLDCTKSTFTGGPPNSAQTVAGANTSNGTFGRFQYFPGPDVFVLINDWDIPAYILRLR